MALFSKLFKEKSIPGNVDANLYKVKTYHSLDLASKDNPISQLIKNKRDVVRVKNAVSRKVQKELLKLFSDVRQKESHRLDTYGMFPKSFVTNSLTGGEPQDYFSKTKAIQTEVKSFLGFDLECFLLNILTSLNNGKSIKTKEVGKKGGRKFNYFQFRALNKKEEIFRVHCENMFFDWVAKDLNYLENDKFKENPIAFFILLQKSEGGELSLFDKRWEQGQRAEALASGFDQIISNNGKEINDCSPKGIKRQLIDAEECEMILFNGGEIWHNIEKIKSSNERITVGAFLEISEEGNHLVWI